MKGLPTLIKLQKARVDEQKLMLARLQAQLQAIETAIRQARDLEVQQKRLLHEKPDMGLTYGAFLERHLRSMESLEKQRNTANLAVELAHDKLAELFEEQKRYEIAQKQHEEAAARLEAVREGKMLDEVGAVGFIRKKG